MEGSRESQGDRLMPATSISRRRFLATAAAIPAALRPRPARGATAVKIGTAVLGDYSMAGPVIVARERGLFVREGLAAEFVPFRSEERRVGKEWSSPGSHDDEKKLRTRQALARGVRHDR